MRVLLALDGSTTAERAASAIASWASDAAPEIHVLTVMNPDDVHETSGKATFTHALTPAGTASGSGLGVTEPAVTLAEDRSQALVRAKTEREDALRDIAVKWFPASSVTVHVEDGHDIPGMIISTAKRLDVAFVAMGARDRGHLSTALFGSVHEAVVRHCPVPVLVIGPAVTAPNA
jgi:nucleotide-binding universal stress UspA family protein